jgi:hypothetical protein
MLTARIRFGISCGFLPGAELSVIVPSSVQLSKFSSFTTALYALPILLGWNLAIPEWTVNAFRIRLYTPCEDVTYYCSSSPSTVVCYPSSPQTQAASRVGSRAVAGRHTQTPPILCFNLPPYRNRDPPNVLGLSLISDFLLICMNDQRVRSPFSCISAEAVRLLISQRIFRGRAPERMD